VTLGVHELASIIAADAGVSLDAGAVGTAPTPQYQNAPQQQSQLSIFDILLAVGVIVVIGTLIRTGHIGWLFFILFNLMGGGGGGRGGGEGGFGGGFGGGGDGGGGFGGFGGGSSGGGGASGDF
jgi:uncharacterized protein